MKNNVCWNNNKNVIYQKYNQVVKKQNCGHDVLPVTQLFRQIDIQNMRENINKLSSIAEGCTDGMCWSDVIQLCIQKIKKYVSANNITNVH